MECMKERSEGEVDVWYVEEIKEQVQLSFL